MEMNGTRAVPAPSDRVWAALNDPEMLKSCIPGCESIEPDGENAYRMVMAAKVGPVSAKFTGKMRLSDIEVPRAYTLRFEGSGGAAGFVNGEARVTLAPDGSAATTLSYAAKAQVGGKLAQVGSRLIEGVAQKLTEEFFTHFTALMSPPVEASAVAGASAPRSKSRAPFVIAATIIVVLAALYLFRRGS